MIPVPIHTLEKDTIQMTDHETHRIIDIESILTTETEATQIIEINDIIIDHEIIQTIDQINKDLIIKKNPNKTREKSQNRNSN